MRALNDGEPVVLEWFVDFNAMDYRGIFSLDQLAYNGVGRQGFHQTVIEDYVVELVDPQTGEVYGEIGEGEVSEEQQELAVRHGRFKYLIVKNSWGANRPDRGSYTVDGEKGFSSSRS